MDHIENAILVLSLRGFNNNIKLISTKPYSKFRRLKFVIIRPQRISDMLKDKLVY